MRLRALRIRVADRGDHAQLLRLSEEVGWNYELNDFLIMERSGLSKTLVAECNGIIGMITVFDYGESGWISNLMVSKPWRERGIGMSLLLEGIRSLEGKRTIALFSTEESVPFYLKGGFTIDRDFYVIRLTHGNHGLVKKGAWNNSIELLDHKCFGHKRGPLLRLLAESGYIVYPEHGEGFAILRPSSKENTVGPVISEDEEFLFSAMETLGIGSTAVTPSPNEGSARTLYKVTRMYIGEKPNTDYGLARAFAGLEYG